MRCCILRSAFDGTGVTVFYVERPSDGASNDASGGRQTWSKYKVPMSLLDNVPRAVSETFAFNAACRRACVCQHAEWRTEHTIPSRCIVYLDGSDAGVLSLHHLILT